MITHFYKLFVIVLANFQELCFPFLVTKWAHGSCSSATLLVSQILMINIHYCIMNINKILFALIKTESAWQ